MRGRAAAWILAGLAAAAPGRAAAAPLPGDGDTGTWSVEDSTEVRERLEEADRLLARGLPEKGVLRLQEILDRFPDHLVRDSADRLRFIGARLHVLERIRALTPAARKAYEEAVGPGADRALERALRLHDAEALEDIGRRWLLAGPAGPRALRALADLRLARGEPGRALAPLRELLSAFAGTPEAGPAEAARLARACGRTGDAEGIASLRASFAGRLDAPVRAGDGEVPLSRILEEAEAEALLHRGTGGSATLGGGPARRGTGSAPGPLGPPRWVESNPRFNWTDTDYRQLNRETAVEQAVKASQPVVPCIVDGVVYTHWTSDVHARDLYTGKERWHFRGPNIHRVEYSRTHGSWLAAPAVRDGILYAPLMVWPFGEKVRTVFFAGQDIIPYLPTRRLFALDAATGAQIWTHADPRPPGDPFNDRLARINTTSAPLVLGDLVIAAGAAYEGVFQATAYAADRRTGEVRWITRLGYGQQEQNLFGRPVKEVPVAAVAAAEGRIYVLSNLGLVSCLEAETGQVLWTRGYRQVPIPYYQTFWTTPEREFTFTGSPPVVSAGVLVVAPADSPDMLGLDAATGALLWTHPAKDGKAYNDPRITRILAADGENVYVAGTVLRALDLRKGRIVWKQAFDAVHQEECTGRGVLADGLLHVPTNLGLWVVDALGAGRVVRRDPWDRAPGDGRGRTGGNLVTADGATVVARLYQMEGHFSSENVRVRAAALLRDRPEDPLALLEAARAYLAADRPEEALPLLRRALPRTASLPPGERERVEVQVRFGIFTVLERRAVALVAEGKVEEARLAFEEASRNASDPADAAGLLLRGARALYDAGRFELAFPLVELVVREFPDARLEEERHLVDRAPGGNTAASYALFYLGVWNSALDRDGPSLAAMHRIIARPDGDLLFGGPSREVARLFIDQVLRRRGPEIYAPFEEKAEAALLKARAAKDAAALARVLRLWPNSRAGLRGALEGARLLLASGEAAAAQSAARSVLALDPGEEESADAGWILAEALARSGKAASARSAFLRLARRHPAVAVETGSGRLPAAEAVARRLAAGDLGTVVPVDPGLPSSGPLRALWELEASLGALPRPLLPRGDPVTGRLLFLQASAGLTGVDAVTGKEVWSATHPAFLGTSVWSDGVLVFGDRDEAVGLEGATGRLLWSTPLPGFVADLTVSEGLAVFLLEGSEDGDQTSLLALDPATGESVWGGARAVAGGAEEILPVTGGVLVLSWDTPVPMVRFAEIADGMLRPWNVPLRRGRDDAQGEVVVSRSGPILVRTSGTLSAYDPFRGTRAWGWSPEGEAEILSAAAGPAVVAVLDTGGRLTAVRVADGRALWSVGAGEGRMFDPSSTGVVVDEGFVIVATSLYPATGELPEGSLTRVEGRDLGTGAVRWSAEVSRAPVLVELEGAGGSLLVRFIGAGPGSGGGTGVVVVDRGTGREVDRVVEERLVGEGFDAAAQAGVLVISGERVVLVRGR